jgi:hypothetical protein
MVFPYENHTTAQNRSRGLPKKSARHRGGENTWPNDKPTPFFFLFPLSPWKPLPLPRVRTDHAHLTPSPPPGTRATQRERDQTAPRPSTSQPLLGSPQLFFPFLSSPSATNRNSQSKHIPFSFSTPPLSSLPPLQHATAAAAAAAAGKSSRALAVFRSGVAPRPLADASPVHARARRGRWRGSVSVVRVRVSGR